MTFLLWRNEKVRDKQQQIRKIYVEQEAVNKEINCSENIFLEAETAYEILYCYLNLAFRITIACANENSTLIYVTM
jgi:hypothetical protein